MPAAALFAVALHALAIAGLTLWRPVPPVTPPGQQEITIDLAPAMEQAEAVSPAEVSRPVASAAEEVVEPAPEPQPVETVQEPAETAHRRAGARAAACRDGAGADGDGGRRAGRGR